MNMRVREPETEAGRQAIAHMRAMLRTMTPEADLTTLVLAIEREAMERGAADQYASQMEWDHEVGSEESLNVEWLAQAIHRTPGVISSGWGYTPEEHLAKAREVAPKIADEYTRVADGETP